MVVQTDLTAIARIRNAALDLFARQGTRQTSVRDVAREAGVSAGLVQHYFSTKADLQDGVNRHVIDLATAAFADLDQSTSPEQSAEELGRRITAFVRDHPDVLTYVARAVVDGDDAALGLFDAFVALAAGQLERLDADGLLVDGLDRMWAPLHVVVLDMATLLMRAAVERHLPEPILDPAGLERWRIANTALFRRAFYRPG